MIKGYMIVIAAVIVQMILVLLLTGRCTAPQVGKSIEVVQDTVEIVQDIQTVDIPELQKDTQELINDIDDLNAL